MNAPNENHAPTTTDDLHDRLLDVALTEVIGGKTPPDLQSRIAHTFQEEQLVTPIPPARPTRITWARVAVAATLLVGMSMLLWPTLRNSREVALTRAQQERLGSSQPLPQTSAAPVAVSQNGSKTQPTTVAKLVEEFNRLNHEQRYLESEIIARRLKELAPNDPVAQQIWKNSKFIRREMLNGQVADNKETSVWTQLNSIEESATAPSPAMADRLGNNTQTKGNAPGSDGLPSVVAQGPNRESAKVTVPSSSQTITWYNEHNHALAPSPRTYGFPAPSNQVEGRAWRGGGRSADSSGPASAPTGAPDATMMAATPRIIIQEEEERLGIAVEREKDRRWGFGPAAPGQSGDKYTRIVENPFIKAEGGDAVSTFSIDVDTASYANVRQFLLQMNQLPPADAVRIEELINYFQYDYAGPSQIAPASGRDSGNDAPFAAHVEVTSCPWNAEHRLARIAVKGREIDRTKRPPSNLVFLVDVSGSMDEPAKLPLVVYGLRQLARELGENDKVAIVVYASSEGLVLPSTRGDKQDTILSALDKLKAGGSTAGGAGIQLAYQIAEDNFIQGGTNRVILCTDGDFNVGVTNTADLQKLVEKKAKDTGVFLSTLGFGRGNLNDAMMVAISDHGNGNYHYIDSRSEARRVLVEEMTGTLVTIAKDVKIQVEFNPAKVAGYRLIGYEKRALRTEDFNDDKKDAGEIGAGHTVTALYEIIPVGKKVEIAPVDDLKYQTPTEPTIVSDDVRAKGSQNDRVGYKFRATDPPSKELLTLKMRYKAPDGDTSKKLEWPVTDDGKSFSTASADLKFAASVTGFGLLLRDSQYKGNLTYSAVQELAQDGIGEDKDGYRKEFLRMIDKAKELRRE